MRRMVPSLSLLLHLVIVSQAAAQLVWNRCIPSYNGSVPVLAVDAAAGVIAGTDSGLYSSTDDGATWTPLGSTPPGGHVYAIAVDREGGVLVGTDSGVYRSADNGGGWIAMNRGLTNTRVRSLAIGGSGTLIAGTYGSGLYRSTDNGGHWTPAGPDGANIATLLATPSGTLFAGTTLASAWGIFRSTDDGVTWEPAREGLKAGNVFAMEKNLEGTLFAAAFHHVPTDPGIYRSTDRGATWNGISLPNTWLTSLAIDSRGDLFAGTKGGGYDDLPTYFGVYRSRDNGETWLSENAGLTNRSVLSLAINAGDFIFAGTEHGLFRSAGPTFSADERSEPESGSGMIRAIYPNPSLLATTIHLRLPRSSHVHVDIYDALGRTIATLWSGTMHSGDHDIVWNTGEVEPGIYACRVTAGGDIDVGTLMVR